MCLRKLCLYAMLATMLSGAAGKRLNRQVFDRPALPVQFLPVQLHPVQSKNARNLGVGKLLVASRNIGDPQFAKSVILLVRYDDKGALGLMLNRRTEIPISRALEGVKGAKERTDTVYLGGPVETPDVFALFRSSGKVEGAEPVFDGVYWITSKELFEQTMSSRPEPGVFHVYLGYAGWTPVQLQKEVELGVWFIFPGEASVVFNADPGGLWQGMIRKTELEMARRGWVGDWVGQ